jgi:hypothetical protein
LLALRSFTPTSIVAVVVRVSRMLTFIVLLQDFTLFLLCFAISDAAFFLFRLCAGDWCAVWICNDRNQDANDLLASF